MVLFERVENPLPVGAGILLQPTGLAVLRRLGLLQRVLARGERIERLSGHTAGGRMVLDLGYADYREGLHGLGIHRGALFAALWETAAAEPRVEVRTGHTVEARKKPRPAWCSGASTATSPSPANPSTAWRSRAARAAGFDRRARG